MKRSVIILLHVGYWILFLLLLLLFFGLLSPFLFKNANVDKLSIFIHWVYVMLGFAIVPAVISFYIFYNFLFPRFLYPKKILLLVLLGITVSIIAALIGYTFLSFLVLNKEVILKAGSSAFLAVAGLMTFGAAMNGIVALVMRGFINWYGDIKLKNELNEKNFKIEMALIRSQLDPHFLFNTINNIDVLIEKDATKASAYLNKLSGIMRFMLYETKTNRIALEKELIYIEKYLDLQKIRTANSDYVNYTVEGTPGQIEIAPMLFIPFIENAFKHADHKKTGTAININIKIEKNTVELNCENSYTKKIKNDITDGGIGSELIQKRLHLLYPATHSLTISDEHNSYKVKLIINIHAD